MKPLNSVCLLAVSCLTSACSTTRVDDHSYHYSYSHNAPSKTDVYAPSRSKTNVHAPSHNHTYNQRDDESLIYRQGQSDQEFLEDLPPRNEMIPQRYIPSRKTNNSYQNCSYSVNDRVREWYGIPAGAPPTIVAAYFPTQKGYLNPGQNANQAYIFRYSR
jgi:hypothetical protein